MSETVEHKPRNNKRLLGAILLALGVLLLAGQIAGAIAGVVVHRVAERRSNQPVVMVEESMVSEKVAVIDVLTGTSVSLCEGVVELTVGGSMSVSDPVVNDHS